MSSAPTNTAGGKHLRRRRNLIINAKFQIKYAVTIMLGVFIGSSLMSFFLYGLLYQQARQRLLHLAPTNVLENTYAIILFAAAFSLLMAVALGAWSVIMTHRIGGPLYVLQKQLEELAQGRIPKPRRLRKHDEFKDLFSTFKNFVGSYASQRTRQTEDVEAVMKLLRSLRASGATPAREIQQIETRLSQLFATMVEDNTHEDQLEIPTAAYDHSRSQPEPVGAA